LNISTGDLDAVFAALSHPDRRRLVHRLATEGRATVGELAGDFDVSLNQVSKHLKTLEEAGLLRREVVGREHHCSLDARPLFGARNWIEAYTSFWTDALDRLDDHLERRRGEGPGRPPRERGEDE